MESKIAKYQIQQVDEPCEIEGKRFDQSVLVKTIIEEELTQQKIYGYLPKDVIYEKINNGDELDLSYAFIEDFSLTEYRQIYGHENTFYVDLNGFDCTESFFHHDLHCDFSYAKFNDKASFRGAIFSKGGVSFYHSIFETKSAVDFKNSAFGKGSINFQYVKFGDQDVLFSFSKFYGGIVSFVNADFGEGQTMFNSCHFHHSKVKFHFAKFGGGDVEFQKTKFGDQTVDFRRVEFGKGKVDFRRTTFGNGFVTFDECEIVSGRFKFSSSSFGDNDISFENIDFGEAEVLFENVDFGRGTLSFYNCNIRSISFRKSKIDCFLNFCVKSADHVDFSEIVLRDIIDMKTDRENVRIKSMNLIGMRNLGRFIFDWEDNDLKALIDGQKDSTYEQKAEQFTIIKENFSLSGLYEQEDLAYIQFKRFEFRHQMKVIKENLGRDWWKLPGMWFKWLVFDKMGLFATSPLRVLFSMIMVYVLFSLTYFVISYADMGLIINSVGAADALNYLEVSFYHSAITFLTIGYGDYYPTSMVRGISVVEGWMGLFLMSYFTVAFVRKILR